ncbi:hypothetical protein [Lysobacter gummosus]
MAGSRPRASTSNASPGGHDVAPPLSARDRAQRHPRGSLGASPTLI